METAKTYQVTIKAPKGRAEFSMKITAPNKESAILYGIQFAKGCGEVVRPGSAKAVEVAS